MELHALMTVGFLGLASGTFGGEAPIPIGTSIGAQTYGNVNSVMVHSLAGEPQVPAATGIFIPIHNPRTSYSASLSQMTARPQPADGKRPKPTCPSKNSASRP